MTPEHQKWFKINKLKGKNWIYENVISLNRYADMDDIITAVEKELNMRIPRTILTPHQLYKWLDTHD